MFGLFKRKKEKKKSSPQLVDLNGNDLKEGDIVFSHRYEMGNSRIITGEQGIEYESLETKKRVSWVLMIDAATDRQKVEKIDPSEIKNQE